MCVCSFCIVFRFVRASKYRHVHGDAAKKTECWQYNRINASGDNPCIAANEKFFAIAVQGGGGPVMVVNHAEKQKYRLQGAPTMNVHKAKTIDFQFYPFAANIIGTASEDCTAKLTVLPADGLTENINEASSSLEGVLCVFFCGVSILLELSAAVVWCVRSPEEAVLPCFQPGCQQHPGHWFLRPHRQALGRTGTG